MTFGTTIDLHSVIFRLRHGPNGCSREGFAMIVVVEPYNQHKYSRLMDAMFRLRARIFHDRLKWDVDVIDGKERDKYDDQAPVYIIHTDEEQCEVKGSLRLLPTTGPTLLADCFADTIPDAAHLSAPTIWEGTRFCLSEAILDRGSSDGLLFASTVMITALGELAVNAGIESVVGNFDAAMLRFYRRLGCDFEILGSTWKYGQPVYLGLFPVSKPLLRKWKRKLASGRLGFTEAAKLVA
jgi:acyl homoserine lactone synthase